MRSRIDAARRPGGWLRGRIIWLGRTLRIGVAGLVIAGGVIVAFSLPASAAITQPGNGQTLQGTVTVTETACGSGSCNGSGLFGECGGAYTNVSIYNSSGGRVAYESNNGGPLSFQWTTETVPNGNYTIVGDWTSTAGQGFGGCRLSGVNQDQIGVTVSNVAVLTNTGASSAPWGTTASLSARLTDPNEGGAPIGGRTVNFSLAGVQASATTNGNGVASVSVSVPATTGTQVLSESFPGDAYYQATSLSLPFEITKHPTRLTYTGPTSATYGDPFTLSAKLIDAATGAALSGAPISFSVAGESLSATTNSSGIAQVTTSLSPSSGPGTYSISLSYLGTSVELPSQASASLTLEGTPTSLAYSGANSATWGTTTNLSATLLDQATGAPLAGQIVKFSLAGASVSAPTNSEGLASASLPVDPSEGPGNYNLKVSFSGTRNRAPSSLSLPFHVAFQYHFVDANGAGTVKVNPGTAEFLFEAPSVSPTTSSGDLFDPQMAVVVLTPSLTAIDITYSSPKIVLKGTFVEQTGAFAAVVDLGSNLYALENQGSTP